MQSKISQWDFTRKNIQLYGIFTMEQQYVDLKIDSGFWLHTITFHSRYQSYRRILVASTLHFILEKSELNLHFKKLA